MRQRNVRDREIGFDDGDFFFFFFGWVSAWYSFDTRCGVAA